LASTSGATKLNKCHYPYRVFISYSHADRQIAEALERHIKNLGAIPIFDKSNPVGTKFTDEIKMRIASSHLFMSVLTENSHLSPWTHQELGYALGLGVPLVPLAFSKFPQGMAEEIHATSISTVSQIASRLPAEDLDDLIGTAKRANKAVHECAAKLADRTRFLVNEATILWNKRIPCKIRQLSGFSSFSIPTDKDDDDAWAWRAKEGVGESEKDLLSQERQILEQHAKKSGCDLILDPFVLVRKHEESVGQLVLKHGKEDSLHRLENLAEFLSGMPDDTLRVVIQKGRVKESIAILGDWISAEAVVPHYEGGYKQTIFTRHGPSVLMKLEEFDYRFERELRKIDFGGLSSREFALKQVEELIGNLRD
jgi:TIR domain-containing protein